MSLENEVNSSSGRFSFLELIPLAGLAVSKARYDREKPTIYRGRDGLEEVYATLAGAIQSASVISAYVGLICLLQLSHSR
ncbi:MAG TPA: hypothetical protein VJH37_02670 [Candidatus Nanoarchaeia archaeon]|nr:hypothetical protein [Candidatus Nanoarchaeia archaeon]